MDRIKSLLEVGFEAWPYFFLIFTYSMVFIFPKKYRKVIWFITLTIVIFFGGFKDTMTGDLLVYKHMYENYRELSLTFVEPFFVVVSYLLNILNLPFYAVSFLYFLLTILFVILAIKNLTSHLEYAFFILSDNTRIFFKYLRRDETVSSYFNLFLWNQFAFKKSFKNYFYFLYFGLFNSLFECFRFPFIAHLMEMGSKTS